MSDGESVRVAVRVRPFNQREKDRNAKLCVRMLDKSTTLVNPEDGKEKTFTFDYSYWSHDGAQELDNGYNQCAGAGLGTDGATYADQQKVFDDLGQGVLNNAYEGFNSCLFAYGQTGSGKSYSMVGYGTNKGIVPITCDEIFKKIDSNKDDKYQFQVTIQMLEIYNEQVRDLFAKTSPSGGLKVRMNPKSGVEVVGLTEWPVGSYKEIDERIETATKNRTVAATNMNATSSRAHTVVTITYTQLEINAKGPGKHSEKKAKMNLVDLAGSERAESTGATGDRLKEGAAINLSLTMLGNVITALAEKSNNPKKNVLVPYRESKLTCILQDALGGNAKTIMICALSPADINFEETLGTLRYADRAKQIKNKPKVNVDPTEALIQQLKAENERLKAQFGGDAPAGGAVMTEEEKEAMKKQLEEEMAAKMAENEKMLAEMNKSWEEKLKEAQEQALKEAQESGGGANAEEEKKKTVPHILNVHEDDLLSRAVCYFFPKDDIINFGNRNNPGVEEILLGGVSIRPDHCRVHNTDDKLTLGVRDECKVLLNGVEVTGDGTELHHNDRLVVGTNYFFVVVHPGEKETEPEGGWAEVNWDFMNREIAKAQGMTVDANWANMTDEEKRRALLNDELVQVMPRVTEANALAAEMRRKIKFETKITPVMTKNEGLVSQVIVQLTDEESHLEFRWTKDKFINRVYIMRELFEKYSGGELDIAALPQDQDPFWDPNEPVNIGYCTVFFKPLAYCMPIDDDQQIYVQTESQGIMHIKMEPCKPDGSPINEDEEDSIYDDITDPTDLRGRRLDVLVQVQHARGLPSKYNAEVFVEFELYKAPNPSRPDGKYVTQVVKGTSNPDFKFTQHVTWESIDEDVLNHLLTGNAFFNVFGLQEDKSGGAQANKKKLLTAAEVDELQAELKKVTEEKDKHMEMLTLMKSKSVEAATRGEAAEGYVLELANCLAEIGFDIQDMVDAAANAPKPQAPAAPAADPAPAPAADGSADKVAELEKELTEAKGKLGEAEGKVKALEEAQAAAQAQAEAKASEAAELQAKLQAAEAAAAAAPAPPPDPPAPAAPEPPADAGGGEAEKVKELEQQVAEAKAGKEAAEAKAKGLEEACKDAEARADAKASEVAELEAKIKALEAAAAAAPGGTPGADEEKVKALEKEVADYKAQAAAAEKETEGRKAAEEKLAAAERERGQAQEDAKKANDQCQQLKGQVDLLKAEASKPQQGSKGCVLQ